MTLFLGDPGLLAAFRQGRREALERVYRTYVRAVEQYLRALARHTGEAEVGQASAIADLIQEVFVRAFSETARRGYDGIREFAPYLTTIARNCFFDALRARGRETLKNPEEIALIVNLDEAIVEPEGWCDPKMLAVLNDYLAALPASLARVHQQRFLLGRSQREACDALGISRRQLRTAEQHLVGGLRKALVRAGISLRDREVPDVDLAARIPASNVSRRSQS
ncbi:MAG TPA: RNA polymerase sigma factor [Polyangia bacterium]|nr:RNA polymerase sigma factor [Polyangia bacterium]